MEFRWNDWNIEHIAEHGVAPEDAERVIRGAKNPYPRRVEDEKWLVWGQDKGGRYLQVIFVMDDEESIFVIHARPLTDREKHRLRRRRK
ncbi:MAG: hypothetical protein L0215_26570 [Gemmataceae bacterium]|nr:hypothetical protein [Gemmataceae bacterium]